MSFAVAVNAVFMDPNVGKDAVYYSGGSGEGEPVRVVLSQGSAAADIFDQPTVSDSVLVFVRRSEVGAPKYGDTFVIDGVTYGVNAEPKRMAQGLVWRMEAPET